jgi:hypothetical protein
VASSWTISGADGTLYTVTTDVTTTYSAVIRGAVTDEIFGSFNMPGFAVELTRDDLQSKSMPEGLYGVSGRPALSFSKLASTSYTVNYTLAAPGFRDYAMQVTIPVNATFPVNAQGAMMRRLPVRLQGRVVSDTSGLPVTGGTVVSADNPNPPSPPPAPPVPHTMLLRSTLYAAHAVGAPVQAVALTQTGTALLAQPAAAGTTTVFLNTTIGLSGTAFIQIMTPDNVLVEYATVASMGPATGQVNLATPLNRSYAVGATASTVNFFTAALAGTAAHLLADPNIGDGILVADALLTASTLVIDDGTPAVEYHEVGAVTDSMGYYAFNGVGRVQELFLQANGATPATPWMIEFDQPTNIVNFSI